MKRIVINTILFIFFSTDIFAQAPQQMFWALNKCRAVLAQSNFNPSAAYSLRRLNCNYTGPAIRVRRNGAGGGTLDIGFTANGSLDTAALKAFVPSPREGFIQIWYDQSGNGKDLEQTTNANQPRIVNNGIVDRENGLPAIVFQDVSDLMLAPSMNIQSFSAVRKAFNGTSSSGYQYLVSVPANADFSIRCGNIASMRYGDNNPDDFWYTGTMYIDNVLTPFYPSVAHCIYADCSTVRTATTFSLSSTFMSRGMKDNDPVFELIVFPRTLPSDQRTVLYANQRIYYGTL